MPFTPFHMGPGILVKALMQGSFSLTVFGWAQIVMDIQPLLVLITGEGHLHGFTHTYIGATLLAGFSALSGKYLAELGLQLVGLSAYFPIKWHTAIISAAIGCYSHVLIDSLMHADLEPFSPFTQQNSLLDIISASTLHELCLYSGLLGGVIFCLTSIYQKWR